MAAVVLRLARTLLVGWLVLALLIGGAAAVTGQGIIDPDADSDGDGTKNSMDPDDDDDGVYDDQDYYPLDPTRWEKEDTPPPPTPTPVTTTSNPVPTPTPFPPTSTPTSVAPGNQKPDFDNDGIPDEFDPDDDNDGIMDDLDSHPFDPSLGSQPTPSTIDSSVDSDGDGIENRVDPDDDNDGVVDEHDSHPFDPERGEKPTPSVIDPRADNDGDGIANAFDPDDDNDGVVDDLDCRPFDPSIQTCDLDETPTPAPTVEARTPVAEWPHDDAEPQLLVSSLPSTGAGAEGRSPVPLAVLMLATIGMFAVSRRVMRPR